METFNNVLYYNARFLGSPGVTRFWKCETFASLIVVSGLLAVLASGINEIIQLNPNAAWMGSIVDEKAVTCINITCGGYYCDFAQPKKDNCMTMPIHVVQDEIVQICTPADKCDWEVKVVTDSGYENRSLGLFVYENTTGDVKNFPQVENMMHQYVDLIKYVNSQFGTTIINWDIQARTITSKMENCPSTIQNSRCGAYTIYFAKTIYEFANQQRYSVELSSVLILTYLKGFVFVKIIKDTLWAYRACHMYEARINGDKTK